MAGKVTGRLFAGLLFAGLLLAGHPCPASSQIVQGRLTDSGSGTPVEGALVLLLNSAGEEVGGYLTNDAGRFLIQAPSLGTYTLRSERIGYETMVSGPITLDEARRFSVDLTTAEKAIELAGIRVEGEQQCVVRPQEGEQLAAVWEEARKALAGQEWAEREGLMHFRISRYSRTLDPFTEAVKDETRRAQSGISGTPIRAIPVNDLLTDGFVQREDDGGYTYYGPDASVMLSDLFLDTHCFRLVREPERPGDLGLGFEPVESGGIPDITGVLWLEAETAGLKSIEYTYTWAPWPQVEGVARGHIEFQLLPNGAWVVPRWWIRMPIAAEEYRAASRGRGRMRTVILRAIREVGGELEDYSAVLRDEAAPISTSHGRLEGIVWDARREAPLPHATVFLSGTQHACETDSAGRFLMEDLPDGAFSAVFDHPRLDSLGVFPEGVEVEILRGEVTEVGLGIPVSAGVGVSSCTEADLETGEGVMSGSVREVGSGRPAAGVPVRVLWSVVHPTSSGVIYEERQGVATASDDDGRYTACGVPLGVPLLVQAVWQGEETEAVQTRANPDGQTVVDLMVGGG